MERRLRLGGKLAIVVAACGALLGPLSVAGVASAAPVERITLAGWDGETVEQVVDRAVSKYGADTVAPIIDSLAARAQAGSDVDFPGVEQVDAPAGDTLHVLSEYVRGDSALPPTVADAYAFEPEADEWWA